MIQFRPFFFQLSLNFPDPLLGLLDLGGDAAAAVLLTPQFFLNPGDVGAVIVHVALQNRHLAIQLLVGSGQHIGFQPDGFQLPVPVMERLSQFLRLPIEGIQIVVSLLQDKGSGGVVCLGLLGGGGQLVQRIQPDGNLHAFQLVLEFQIFFCLFRLHFQRFQLQFQFRNLVPDAKEVVLGGCQLPLRLLLAVAVLGDTGGFLENFPAVAAFQGENFVDAALTDVGVALLAKARVHEQLVNVPEPGGLLIDIVFAVAGAVIPAGNHDLVGIVGQRPVGVVQCQRGLGKAHGTALLGAAENHVLHLGAPQGLGALLPQYPEDGIGDIRFAGAVGADNGGDVVAKADQRLIREGLEAL